MIAGLGLGAAASLVVTALATYVWSRLVGGFSVWVVDALLWGGVAASVALSLAAGRRRRDSPGPVGATARALGLSLLPFTVLVPGLLALVTSPRLQMSFHGYLHSAYAYQALDGHLPPENPLLAGTAGNDYWLFHVLLAGVSHVLRVAPPVAGTLLNILALGASLGAIVWLLRTLDLLPRHPLLRTCAALFVLLAANLGGSVHAGIRALLGEDAGDPMGISTMVLSGAARSAGLFPKFLNFNGFPVGVAFFLLALGGTVAATRRVTSFSLACAVTGVLGALAFHVTTGLFAVMVLPASFAIACLAARRKPTWAVSLRTAAVLAGLGITGLVILLLYVWDLAGALGPGASLEVWDPANLRRFFGVTYPLLPLFALGAADALRNRRAEVIVLAFVGAFGAVGACVAVLPDDNQYKFDYLAAIAMAVVALTGLRRLASLGSPAIRVAGVAAAAGIALVVANVLYQGIAYARSDLAAQDTIAYEGVNVEGEGPNSGAWEWIAANSRPDTVVVTPVAGANRAPVLALSRRPVFVVDGGPFTAGKRQFRLRSAMVGELYRSPHRISRENAGFVLARIRDQVDGRPVIVAVPSGYEEVSYDFLPVVYNEDGVKVYDVTFD